MPAPPASPLPGLYARALGGGARPQPPRPNVRDPGGRRGHAPTRGRSDREHLLGRRARIRRTRLTRVRGSEGRADSVDGDARAARDITRWPRGVSREQAKLDAWDRELPPSAKLRQWFAHDPRRFQEFRRRYIEELRDQRSRLTELRRRARRGTFTLVYSARDTEHNDAVVLAEVLRRGLPKAGKRSRRCSQGKSRAIGPRIRLDRATAAVSSRPERVGAAASSREHG